MVKLAFPLYYGARYTATKVPKHHFLAGLALLEQGRAVQGQRCTDVSSGWPEGSQQQQQQHEEEEVQRTASPARMLWHTRQPQQQAGSWGQGGAKGVDPEGPTGAAREARMLLSISADARGPGGGLGGYGASEHPMQRRSRTKRL
jgi:hypothetical protein